MPSSHPHGATRAHSTPSLAGRLLALAMITSLVPASALAQAPASPTNGTTANGTVNHPQAIHIEHVVENTPGPHPATASGTHASSNATANSTIAATGQYPQPVQFQPVLPSAPQIQPINPQIQQPVPVQFQPAMPKPTPPPPAVPPANLPTTTSLAPAHHYSSAVASSAVMQHLPPHAVIAAELVDRPDASGRFGPERDVHVVITDPHAGPHFFIGPNHDDFHFVHVPPTRVIIRDRDSLRDLLLRPLANAVAWGIGDIATVELANALGLPVNTTLYAVAPGVPVISTLPPGYFVAESVPSNVALVSNGPAGPVVLCSRVPPGAFVAYQTSATGVVLNECVVVPPVQQVVLTTVPVPATPAPVVVTTAPAPTIINTTPAAPQPVAAAPAEPSSTSIPMSPKVGKILYDANQKPIGVMILDPDGKQEFVPLASQ